MLKISLTTSGLLDKSTLDGLDATKAGRHPQGGGHGHAGRRQVGGRCRAQQDEVRFHGEESGLREFDAGQGL